MSRFVEAVIWFAGMCAGIILVNVVAELIRLAV